MDAASLVAPANASHRLDQRGQEQSSGRGALNYRPRLAVPSSCSTAPSQFFRTHLPIEDDTMRLLAVDTFELVPPQARPPRYAILSHTWGEREASFEEVQSPNYQIELHAALRAARNDDLLSCPPGISKILGSCELALEKRYDYVWIDTCCIDKSNSTELSEALNSMYRWYAEAEVCFVYLSDVPDNDHIQHRHSKFRESRWFRRGWTLQELLAPRRVEFYSAGWKLIGVKSELTELISSITLIPQQVLASDTYQPGHHSIGEVFSWASRRQTTLAEDAAYCMLGLLDVHMTLIYGEGSKAFLRLQEELLRRYDDESIFAWEAPPMEARAKPLFGLLSPSVSYFQSSHRFRRPMTRTRLGTGVTLTNKGISLQLPRVAFERSEEIFLALLNCRLSNASELEIQPAIKVQRLSGDQYARIDVHHIHEVRTNSIPFSGSATPDFIPQCSMIVPHDPKIPPPVTAFAWTPDFKTMPTTPNVPYNLHFKLVGKSGNNWKTSWSGVQQCVALRPGAILPASPALSPATVHVASGFVVIELCWGDGQVVPGSRSSIFFGLDIEESTGRTSTWCSIALDGDEAHDATVMNSGMPAHEMQTEVKVTYPGKFKYKHWIIIAVDIVEKQFPGCVLYDISLENSRWMVW